MGPLSCILRPIYETIKKQLFQRALVFILALFKLVWCCSGTCCCRYRNKSRRPGFEYAVDVSINQRRLTFSFYEFNYKDFDRVVLEGLQWIAAYRRKTGFVPDGFAFYFCTQGNTSKPDVETTFSFDPVFHDPINSEWSAFCEAFSFWARDEGAVPALNQTVGIEKFPDF